MLNRKRVIWLVMFPSLAFAPPNKVEIKQSFDYAEYLRQKINCILELEDGSNYWEFKNKTKQKELLIKKYLGK